MYKDLSEVLGRVLDATAPQPLPVGGWAKANKVNRAWLKAAIASLADVLSDDPAFDGVAFMRECGADYAKS
jgi:hypothetical protein